MYLCSLDLITWSQTNFQEYHSIFVTDDIFLFLSSTMGNSKSDYSKKRKRRAICGKKPNPRWRSLSGSSKLKKLSFRRFDYEANGLTFTRIVITRPLSRSESGAGCNMRKQFEMTRETSLMDRDWCVAAEECLIQKACGASWTKMQRKHLGKVGYAPSSQVQGSTMQSECRIYDRCRNAVTEMDALVAECSTDDSELAITDLKKLTLVRIAESVVEFMRETNSPQFRNSKEGRQVRQLLLTAIMPSEAALAELAAKGVSKSDLAEVTSSSLKAVKNAIGRKREFEGLVVDNGGYAMNPNMMKVRQSITFMCKQHYDMGGLTFIFPYFFSQPMERRCLWNLSPPGRMHTHRC